jgi:hypothetical protein
MKKRIVLIVILLVVLMLPSSYALYHNSGDEVGPQPWVAYHCVEGAGHCFSNVVGTNYNTYRDDNGIAHFIRGFPQELMSSYTGVFPRREVCFTTVDPVEIGTPDAWKHRARPGECKLPTEPRAACCQKGLDLLMLERDDDGSTQQQYEERGWSCIQNGYAGRNGCVPASDNPEYGFYVIAEADPVTGVVDRTTGRNIFEDAQTCTLETKESDGNFEGQTNLKYEDVCVSHTQVAKCGTGWGPDGYHPLYKVVTCPESYYCKNGRCVDYPERAEDLTVAYPHSFSFSWLYRPPEDLERGEGKSGLKVEWYGAPGGNANWLKLTDYKRKDYFGGVIGDDKGVLDPLPSSLLKGGVCQSSVESLTVGDKCVVETGTGGSITSNKKIQECYIKEDGTIGWSEPLSCPYGTYCGSQDTSYGQWEGKTAKCWYVNNDKDDDGIKDTEENQYDEVPGCNAEQGDCPLNPNHPIDCTYTPPGERSSVNRDEESMFYGCSEGQIDRGAYDGDSNEILCKAVGGQPLGVTYTDPDFGTTETDFVGCCGDDFKEFFTAVAEINDAKQDAIDGGMTNIKVIGNYYACLNSEPQKLSGVGGRNLLIQETWGHEGLTSPLVLRQGEQVLTGKYFSRPNWISPQTLNSLFISAGVKIEEGAGITFGIIPNLFGDEEQQRAEEEKLQNKEWVKGLCEDDELRSSHYESFPKKTPISFLSPYSPLESHQVLCLVREGEKVAISDLSVRSTLSSSLLHDNGNVYVCKSDTSESDFNEAIKRTDVQGIPTAEVLADEFVDACNRVEASVGSYYCAAKGIWKEAESTEPLREDSLENTPRNELERYKTNPSRTGCCPANSCWTGHACIATGETFKVSEDEDHGWYCQNERLLETATAIDQDGEEGGLCGEKQCWWKTGDDEGHCIANYQSSPDNSMYCNAGDWTTRTNLLATQLLFMADMKDSDEYSVYCDDKDKALLNLVPAQYQSPQGVFDSIQSACVLRAKYDTVKPKTVLAVGVVLSDQDASGKAIPGENQDIPLLGALTATHAIEGAEKGSTTYCKDAINRGFSETFVGCKGEAQHTRSQSQVWYNVLTNTLIFSPQQVQVMDHCTAIKAGIIQSSFITRAWCNIQSLFDISEVTDELNFVEDVEKMSKLYLARNGDKAVHAAMHAGTGKIHAEYTDFHFNLCSLVDPLKTADDDKCVLVPGEKAYFNVSVTDASAWQELTSKLRLQDEETSDQPIVLFKETPYINLVGVLDTVAIGQTVTLKGSFTDPDIISIPGGNTGGIPTLPGSGSGLPSIPSGGVTPLPRGNPEDYVLGYSFIFDDGSVQQVDYDTFIGGVQHGYGKIGVYKAKVCATYQDYDTLCSDTQEITVIRPIY